MSVVRNIFEGRSPGLVVMGGDSCSKGRGFESQRRILDGHFSHLLVVKIVMFEKTKINEKEAGEGPFKKISIISKAISFISMDETAWQPFSSSRQQSFGQTNRIYAQLTLTSVQYAKLIF